MLKHFKNSNMLHDSYRNLWQFIELPWCGRWDITFNREAFLWELELKEDSFKVFQGEKLSKGLICFGAFVEENEKLFIVFRWDHTSVDEEQL